MNNYKVYCHTLFDGRKYIGITCQKLNNRWRKNGEGYKTTIHFYRAIQKYGWNKFQHILIADNLTKEQAEQMEIDLIKKYKTNISKFGFNISNGGNTLSGYKHSIKAKEKISKALKGKTPYNKGVPMSEEQKIKISKANKGKKLSKKQIETIKQRTSKKVLCIEINKVFDSLSNASQFINGNRHICDACKGTRETAGGYHWKYVN